jgi:RimJ/RimL family protein N-acetyltransferase
MILETHRLILRRPEAADWPAYLAYRLSDRSTVTGDDEAVAWTMFAAIFGHWTLRGFGRFIAVRRDTGAPIGHFGPHHPEGQAEPELTWTLWDATLEGRGWAFEAAAAARDHAFSTLAWPTAVSYIVAGNDRSARLAARLGATPDPLAARHLPQLTVWRHHPGPHA